ncbi:unnamed protein product [Mytilus coruscus]|uniref:Uncharacterized protein n=1 Tax=Mytilus coruscus TaxID=42192 RepID=A0A6J8BVW8_MYTCO|nr:unnamed protein product [Mytilus coruscus]
MLMPLLTEINMIVPLLLSILAEGKGQFAWPFMKINFHFFLVESILYQCAEENTDNFMSEWEKANQEMSHLLNRNTEIVVRATKLPQCDIPSMNFQPDIDGIVVELTSFAGITFPLTHISILRNDFNSLERMYPKLKKHLDLRHYSEQTLSVLAQCKGTEISIEGPWHIWLGVVPLPGTLPQATATATIVEKPEVDIPKPTKESEDVNQIQDVVEDYGENTQCQDVEKPPTTHLPMAVNTFWTAPELEILHAFNTKEYRKSTFKQLF